MVTVQLSKSKFIAGCQCLRRLWLEVHRPELAPPVDPVTQAIFDAGERVGSLVRECFPAGVRVTEEYYQHQEAIDRTVSLLSDARLPAIFEAAFQFDDVRIRTDILERGTAGGWRLIEVKSSTQCRDEHILDVAIQHYVPAGCGLTVESDHLMHVNRDYVYDGEVLDPHELLAVEEVTGLLAEVLDDVPALLAEQKAVVADGDEPAVSPGFHCADPWECPFAAHCTADKPTYWIRNLPGINRSRLSELTDLGIEDIADIPDDYPLSPQQARARHVTQTGEPWVCSDPAAELASVRYPIHFLDFETISTAIPRYAGTRPYETIPFQWSLHTLQRNGRLRHAHYLCKEDPDPRTELAEALLQALGKRGTILAYSAGYETGIIRRLAERLPDLADALEATLARVFDLLGLVRSCYYHCDFRGAYSLKRVLPVMAPDAAYDDLAIQDGSLASVQYLSMLAEPDPRTREKVKSDLLAYSERDTWAMVRIWQELNRLAG